MALSKWKIFVFVVLVMLTSIVVSFFVAIAVSAQKDRIYPGIKVEGIEMGLLTKSGAMERLKELNSELRDKEITVIWSSGQKTFKLANIDTEIDVKSIVERAWKYGREGSLINQYKQRKQIADRGVNIPLKISYSEDSFNNLIKEMAQSDVVEPQDAKLVITPEDTVEIIPGEPGKTIDSESALEDLKRIIYNNENPVIKVSLKEKQPQKTAKDIEDLHINGLLARFSTFFNVSKISRVYNIKVAADAMDGHLIKPGEEFSFNKVVGPRSKEAGYKMAPTILNNEFIDSLGGGVCQASTTLYNTVLLAGLDIVERSNHSLVVSYVPLGQDAAVAYGYKDFKFKNNLDCSLIIKTELKGNRLTIKIFGYQGHKKQIEISNRIVKTYPFEVIKKEDSAIPNGQEVVKQKGVNGYKVESQKIIYQDGNIIAKEDLPSSHYNSLDQVILTGTKKDSQQEISGDPKTPNEIEMPDDVNSEPTIPDMMIPEEEAIENILEGDSGSSNDTHSPNYESPAKEDTTNQNTEVVNSND